MVFRAVLESCPLRFEVLVLRVGELRGEGVSSCLDIDRGEQRLILCGLRFFVMLSALLIILRAVYSFETYVLPDFGRPYCCPSELFCFAQMR